MKLRLEDIPEEGLDVSFELRGAKPAELGSAVEALAAPPWASLHVEQKGEFVLARGRAGAKLRLSCSRCLEPIEMALDQALDLAFEPLPEVDADEIELRGDEMDVSFYRDGEVDLGEAVLEELSFAVPMAPLCRPDCPGVCPRCGQAHGEGGCQCQTESIDPRWGKLAQLRPKQD